MQMPLLSLKSMQLRLVVAIARHGKLLLAANEVALSQPAASRMLSEIERQLDAPLFVRNAKGMVPTEIGQRVARRAQAMLREMRALASEVQSLREGLDGSVNVGAVTGPAVGYLVPAIRKLKAASPGAEVRVDVAPSRELLGHLSAGRLDFALARLLPDFDRREFEIHPVRDEKVSLLVRAGHPIASMPSVTLAELAEYEWVMQDRGNPIREAMAESFGAAGLSEPRNIIASPSLLLMIAYLSQSDAIAPVSDEVFQLLVNAPVNASFATLRLSRPIRVSPYFLLSLKGHPLSPVARRLRDLFLAESLAVP